MKRTYSIKGMTCQHCVRAISTALGAVDSVESVTVDLAGGSATVSSARPLADPEVIAAVEGAGYEVGR